MAPKLNYCNTINNVGTIHNEYIIAMAGSEEAKIGILKGKDSACGNVVGPISSFKLSAYTDFMLGGYNTNFDTFQKRGIVPPSIFGFTPIIGLNFKIPITDTIKINNLVSFGIITHALSLEF